MISGTNQQIVTLFEDCDMTPEQIAKDQELDILAVKAVLMQCSMKYRALTREKKGVEPTALDFTDDELARANQVIAQVGMESEDDNLRVKCAMYIRDDKKGRKDVKKGIKNLTVNALTFNIQLQKANEAVERAKKARVLEMSQTDLKQLNA